MDIKLVMFRESGERRDFTLAGPRTTIGRKDDCDIRIPLAEISRHHAELRLTPAGVVLKDLGSANGTFVNNKRIKAEVPLGAGDHVVVGPVVFTLLVNGKPDNVRAVKTKLRAVAASSQSAAGVAVASAASEEIDPISALEALASSADQTAIDPFDDEEGVV